MRYLIIGGVAGGATVAARLRRMDENAVIVIFEKGKHISYANCGLPYYVGGTISDRNALFLQTPTSFGNRFDADVRTETEVTAINPVAKTVHCKHIATGKEYEEGYDKLVIATGSVAVRPPIPGINAPNIFTLKDIPDTDNLFEYLQSLSISRETIRAAIIGAGFIGIETAENLSKRGCDVTIIEKADHVMPTLDREIAAQVQQHLTDNHVKVLTRNGVIQFAHHEQGTEITLESGETLMADLIVVSVGVRPQNRLALEAGIAIGERGGIQVNEYMQTSVPDIYAVGDVVETIHPITGTPQLSLLAGPANKQARICANNLAEGNKYTYKGSINTAIAKVFNLSVGATGLSEESLKKAGIPYATSITHTASHATYYPGGDMVTIKINFSKENGQLFGAFVIGKEGVDKRLDILADTIAHKGTVFDLSDFDHGYAPPFSSPKDPVTVSGLVAENIIHQYVHMIQWHELRSLWANPDSQFLLIDVRSFLEHRAGSIPGDVNYPLDELREYLEDIPTDTPIITYCAIGLRGYIASRILLQSGFTNVRNLAGGFKTYQLMEKTME